ncbi:Protein CBG23645 [Caenorhabditis briggsae]|uniref:Protein CBG23645 n=1 Tax=Caenorhabditis briggsae TaxID=6238 RepID=A8WJ03_CAEBR|nr:Protein CBG23645 [Caenorhabditis briggsae]CAP20448.1 Protein CBG23645 [Caenorhabditis briggsae]
MSNTRTLNDIQTTSDHIRKKKKPFSGVGKSVRGSETGTITITEEDFRDVGLKQAISILGGVEKCLDIVEGVCNYTPEHLNNMSQACAYYANELINIANEIKSIENCSHKNNLKIKLFATYQQLLLESNIDERHNNHELKKQVHRLQQLDNKKRKC